MNREAAPKIGRHHEDLSDTRCGGQQATEDLFGIFFKKPALATVLLILGVLSYEGLVHAGLRSSPAAAVVVFLLLLVFINCCDIKSNHRGSEPTSVAAQFAYGAKRWQAQKRTEQYGQLIP
eukprot:SAG31_NODE_4431_length_3236_cov_2.397832_4_plen_121_part_00